MNVIVKHIISKRNTDIHATIISSGKQPAGLVLFAHGFRAERTEGDRFIRVGQDLAQEGISSISIDFPGCGDSIESFDNYCLSNCLDDLKTAYDYMLNNYKIDTNKLAVVGYSMGGRLACLFVDRYPEFKNIILWASASYNAFNGEELFLDNPVQIILNDIAEKGYAEISNTFDGAVVRLSKQFIDDIVELKPYDALINYKGNVLLIHGTQDKAVDSSVSKKVFNDLKTKNKKELVLIENANHGFGLWDDHMEQSKILVDTTIRFIKNNFKDII